MADNSTGISLWTALQLIFVVLKLTDNLTWSWWLVLVPFEIEVAIAAIWFLGYVVMSIGQTIVRNRRLARDFAALRGKEKR